MDKREELIKIFSKDIREILKQVTVDFEQVQEIRLRVHAPLLMICSNREYYITREGNLSMRAEEAYLVTRDALKETLDYMSSYSLYAFEEEIRQGFITIQGGPHRYRRKDHHRRSRDSQHEVHFLHQCSSVPPGERVCRDGASISV